MPSCTRNRRWQVWETVRAAAVDEERWGEESAICLLELVAVKTKETGTDVAA